MTVATAPPGLVLEGFAGPGGWSTGLDMLPVDIRGVGIEWDDAACKTAKAAGHTRVRADVARFDLTAFAGLVWLLIMSPPCQAWSRSGKRKGILDQEAIFRHAMRVTAAGEWIDYADAGPLPRRPGPKPEPLPEPVCVTCEHGAYMHDEGSFCAECNDTCPDPSWPDQPAQPVDDTKYGDEGGTWHDARSPLVLEVLRWVLAVQPANICLEQVPDVLPFWELIARWLRGQGYSVWAGCLSSERYGVPQTRERAILIASRERAVSAPPATHTAYDSRLGDGGRWHGADDDLFGGGLEPWVSMVDALGGLPDVRSMGDVRASNGTIRDIGHAAGTITASLDNGNYQWVYVNGNQAHAARRPTNVPAPTVMFSERSNKVDWVGLRLVATGPGSRPTPVDMATHGYQHPDQSAARLAALLDAYDTEGASGVERVSVRVTVEEAAVLQGFPADYPWRGMRSAQFRQVGDAIPPHLAAAIIGTCLGLDWQAAVAAHCAAERAA
jgi:DNA (cytosine-5)-methyltransferase 1